MLVGNKFERKDLEKSADVVTLKLNVDERNGLEELKLILEQKKDGTALKQLASIGAKVLLEEKTRHVLEVVFKNKRKNKRMGIVEFD